MYDISVFIHVKVHLFQNPRETLFQTVIKETRCLVSENHIFENM